MTEPAAAQQPTPPPAAPPSLSTPRPTARPTATAVWFTRLVGLVIVAVGLWLFASVTLGYDLPALQWRLAWPVVLIAIGVFVIASALGRRR